MSPEVLDLLGLAGGAVLTLLILSYALGDNPLYRFALQLFTGAVVGYSFGVALRVLIGKLFEPLLMGRETLAVVPAILAVFMLLKGLRRYEYLGNLSVAYLVGVGAAVALSGALLGTIVPQVGATGQAFAGPGHWIMPVVVLIGTLATLLLFSPAARQEQGPGNAWDRVVAAGAAVGRYFLVIALGVGFAGAVTAALSVFTGRVQYLIDLAVRLFGG